MFHYYTQQEVDMANYTMSNASFIAEIKMLQLHLIFYGKLFFNPRNGKCDGSCLHMAVVSDIIAFSQDVWSERFPSGKKPGVKQALFEVMNDLKEFILAWNQGENEALRKYLGHEVNIDDLIEVTI